MFGSTTRSGLHAAILGIAGLAAWASIASADLYIQGLGANQGVSSPLYDRFYTGADKAFIGQAFDWSGVGQLNGAQWATMISPQYFVSIGHFYPASGQLTFYSDNNTNDPQTFTIDSTFRAFSYGNGSGGSAAVYVGRLTAPIPASDHIAYYPILQEPALPDNDHSNYDGLPLYVCGKSPTGTGADAERVGRNLLTTAVPGTMYYVYNTYGDPDTVGADECLVQGGDSGGPSFTVIDGALALLGLHQSVSGAAGVDGSYSEDTLVSDSISWLDSEMVGQQVTVVAPEPGALWLVAAGLAGLLAYARRKRK